MRLLCLLKKITSKSELLQDINVLIWNELQYQLDHFPVKEVGSGLEIGEQHSAPSLILSHILDPNLGVHWLPENSEGSHSDEPECNNLLV